jgi:outer membrane protein OmpA-like peptidoglycan-associated protein
MKRSIKVAAILFVALSFKTIISNAENTNPVIFFNSGIKNSIKEDKIVISGTIKDDDGNPVENAKVIFDTTAMAVTDKDGKFSFELGAVTPGSHNIYFTSDGLTTVVRTYYPVMLSSNYTVVLRKQIGKTREVNTEPVHPVIKDSVITIKKETVVPATVAPAPATSSVPAFTATSIVLDLPSIIFKANATELSGENKSFLDIVADKLKANPSVKIDVKAYMHEHDNNSYITQRRLANIVKYLVEKKGVAASRLKKVTVVGGGEENTIDLMNSEEK